MTKEEVIDFIGPKIIELFDLLGVEAEVEIRTQTDEMELEDEEKNRTFLRAELTTQNGAEYIGKHGSRLQDLNNVINMFLPEEAREFTIVLDINGYRAEREDYVRQLAKRNIEHAALTATEVELEPMLPWERRLVHMVAADRTDVNSESIGEKESRRVIIKPVGVI